MSILDFPRLHFRGFARANVPTANRNTHGHIDIATNTVSMEGKPFDPNRAPSEFHAYLKQLAPRFNAAGMPDPEGIFSQAAGYNFCGNNHFSWENTSITGVQLHDASVDTEDSLVGARLALWGHYNDYLRTTFNRARWVDNHPGRPDSTLIYAGQFTLSGKQATPSTPALFSADIRQAHSVRWLGSGHITERSGHFLDDEFGRSRLFQFSVAKCEPHFVFNQDAPLPASLRALRQALDDDDVLGLTIQYALFNMSTPHKPDTPVFYDLTGSIGPWRRDELATYPAGRLLLPRQRSLGPVLVKVHAGRVSLNMPTAIPFTTRAASAVSEQHPTHALGGQQALGDLLLRDGCGTLLARIPQPLYLDYWRHHGVVDVPLLHAAAASGSLCLGSAQAQWDEADWVLQSDSNQLYLEAPNRHKQQEFPQTITLQSRFRGALAVHPALAAQVQEAEDGALLALQLQPSVLGHGYAELRVTGRRSGATRIMLGEGKEQQCLGVRVLPDDWHLDEVAAEQVDYAFLYRHVMSYYELVYPFMADKVFSLADQCKCETYSRLMWQMCDPQNRDKSYYMPSTRELSLPKSRLFLKYLAQVEAAAKAALPEPAAAHVIRGKDELIGELKQAIDLELSLMLQYLYAAYSIPNYAQGVRLVDAGRWLPAELELACGTEDRRRNSGTRGALLAIAHEEMIHYLLINNVLMALGEPFHAGAPMLGQQARQRFGLDTEFAFEPFSELVLARLVRFEWPDYLPTPGKSIATFYTAIRQALADLPGLFDDNRGKRGGEHHLFLKELTNRAYPAYQLEVCDRDSALFAIDFVTEQGEGVAVDSPHFASSHFQRLRTLAGRFAARGQPFEPAVPALKNPVLEARPDCTVVTDRQARSLMRLYQGCYELTFLLMAHHFAQQPLGSLRRSRLMNASIDIMTGVLRPLSVALMNMPSGLPGRNAGPPVPEPVEGNREDQAGDKISGDYRLGCEMLAQKCLALAQYARCLETDLVGMAPIDMLEFFHRQLTDLSRGTMSREA
ncbi:iminophenyl-pyruvate dimer synthase VioB [Janthinobacterium agaricidamnosum]|uniref:Violacein biosynthesis protein vioB n=1 Tax=Janthinobacterium agaricidamnosum NBRC 102515 = DSM 9628 TaxID=1349767 RepID=W0V1I0_9BURK|nr:iminophenyl-pyruvate dimer synthase VioB [Janthinobacterium agaricidamnosum]CDG81736.1 violacein biosynthesis protein vioB [Janthinobacterium agaricidamnosum NBRC 102515 = DSM 9628]